MYSLNIPVPGHVAKRASEIAHELPEAYARPRGQHTLGVKRLVDRSTSYSHLEARAREVLVGQPAFEIRLSALDYFVDPPTGTAPVLYFAVESPELLRLHHHLATVFEPLNHIEGEAYIPHVTIARGGSLERTQDIATRDIDPVTWTVTKLVFWDSERGQPVSTVSLPA